MRRRYYRRKITIAKKEQPFFLGVDNMVHTKEEKQPFFQTQGDGLKVGQPEDKYEQEADAMADAVMGQEQPGTSVLGEDQSTIQKKENKEEELQTKIQLQTEEEVQTQSQTEEEEPLQMKTKEEAVQTQALEEEKSLQAKEEEEPVQMKTEEEEERVQAKEKEELATKTQAGGNPSQKTGTNLSQQIKQSRGQVQTLSPKVKQKMEGAFGTDFSRVNVHTGEQAAQMNQELHAQAFAHGDDLYFNSGKYQPESAAGQHLLAHELTHVVQQRTGDRSLKRTLQPKRVSNGGFGKTLEGFTKQWSISDKVINRLQKSSAFMKIVSGLDKNYVDRNSSFKYNPESDGDQRIISGDKGMPKSYFGKKELFITSDPSGSSFQSYFSPDNPLSGDLISLQIRTEAEFIQSLVHESVHAHNHVTGSAPSPQTLLDSVQAGIQEELGTRKKEASILNDINTGGKDFTFAPVGSTVPAEVARDFSPGLGLTYLEQFFFSFRLLETQKEDGLTDEESTAMREQVSENPEQGLVFMPQLGISGMYELSEYGMTWQDRLKVKKSWTSFNFGSASAQAREARLQEHAKKYFKGLIRYSPLP